MAGVETRDRPPGASGLLRLYIAMWAALAAVALAYLTALVVRPDLVAEFLPAPPRVEQDVVQVQRSVEHLAADVQRLRQNVADLQRTGAQVKAALDLRIGQDTGAAERLAVVESQVSQLAADVNRLEVLKVSAPVDSAAPRNAVPRKAPTLPAGVKPKTTSASQTSTIETGSLGSTGSFGSTVVTPASAPMAIYLSKGSSLDALRLAWGQMAEQHKGALGKLAPHYYRASGSGEAATYQLIAGPIENADQANQVCMTLRAVGIGCRVGTFAGEAL